MGARCLSGPGCQSGGGGKDALIPAEEGTSRGRQDGDQVKGERAEQLLQQTRGPFIRIDTDTEAGKPHV